MYNFICKNKKKTQLHEWIMFCFSLSSTILVYKKKNALSCRLWWRCTVRYLAGKRRSTNKTKTVHNGFWGTTSGASFYQSKVVLVTFRVHVCVVWGFHMLRVGLYCLWSFFFYFLSVCQVVCMFILVHVCECIFYDLSVSINVPCVIFFFWRFCVCK